MATIEECETMTRPKQALHRTANCAWGFALESLLFINHLVAVGELTSEVIRQGIFLRFFRAVFDRRFPQLNLIEQTD